MTRQTCIRFGLFSCLLFIGIVTHVVNSASVSLSKNEEQVKSDVLDVDLVGTRLCDGIVQTAAGLNIREKPTSKSKKVGAYKNGTKVKILEGAEGENVDGVRWWYRTKKGWVSGRYLVINCRDEQQDKNPAQAPVDQVEQSEMEEYFSDEKALA